MILDCQNICKAFGTDVILDNISFHLEEKEKMAIVGINGAGKTTLLKIIMGSDGNPVMTLSGASDIVGKVLTPVRS